MFGDRCNYWQRIECLQCKFINPNWTLSTLWTCQKYVNTQTCQLKHKIGFRASDRCTWLSPFVLQTESNFLNFAVLVDIQIFQKFAHGSALTCFTLCALNFVYFGPRAAGYKNIFRLWWAKWDRVDVKLVSFGPNYFGSLFEQIVTCSFICPDGIRVVSRYFFNDLFVDALVVHSGGSCWPQWVVCVVTN